MLDTKKTVAKIKEKDEDAFNELYEQYQKLVSFVINKIVRDEETTRELSQDAFITVYKKIDQYRGGSLKAWICTIAKNIALNYKTRVVNKNRVLQYNEKIVSETNEEKSKPLGRFDEILDRYFKPEEKDLVFMRLVLSLSFKEIGEIINEKPEKIRAQYNKILKTLRIIIKEYNL